jgi:hypothetical protein
MAADRAYERTASVSSRDREMRRNHWQRLIGHGTRGGTRNIQ